MKVTVMKDPDEKKDFSLLPTIIMFLLGIILLLDANKIITIIFMILGGIVIIYGIYRFLHYEKMKNQFHVEDGNALISGVSAIAVGLVIILLSSILSNAIQVVTGVWLIFIGISKLNRAMIFKGSNQSLFIQNIIGAILFLVLGIYSIFAKNVIFMIIGIILMITAGYDFYQYFQKNGK